MATIKGFASNIVVPVKVETVDGIQKLKVEFKRMTRKQALQNIKSAKSRGKRQASLEAKLIEIAGLESELERADGDARSSLEKKIEELNPKKTQRELDKLSVESDNELKARIVGWSGLEDEDGNEFEYNEDNLELLIDHPDYFNALDAAQYKATGAAIKN